MPARPDFRIDHAEGGEVLALSGDWTAATVNAVADRLGAAGGGEGAQGRARRLDVRELGRFDTAGAFVLTGGAGVDVQAGGLEQRPDVERLLALVSRRAPTRTPPQRPMNPLYGLAVRAGQGVSKVGGDLFGTFVFYGQLLVALGRLIVHPSRLRIAPAVSLMERAGLDAMPIVAVTTFFIGATVGFLGANLLTQFGASVFSVELIGIAVLREFAVLITAVLLAGRSASAFAAELGAMKMNQEVDAMRTMGVDPFEALVLPRFIALLTMMPLLTFVAALAGLAGGMMVVWAVLDLSPAFFLQRLLDNVGPRQFYLGIVKAPVMAMVIAAIGCRQGLEVGGDVEQLGRRVTTAVVQAIFTIIVIDAGFALLFMQLGQ